MAWRLSQGGLTARTGRIDDVARTDTHRIADVRRDPEVTKQLILALARSVAAEVTAPLRALAPLLAKEHR